MSGTASTAAGTDEADEKAKTSDDASDVDGSDGPDDDAPATVGPLRMMRFAGKSKSAAKSSVGGGAARCSGTGSAGGKSAGSSAGGKSACNGGGSSAASSRRQIAASSAASILPGAGPASAAAARGVVNTTQDGRFGRLKAGVIADISQQTATTDVVCDFMDCVDEEKIIGVGAKFIAMLKAKVKAIAKVVTACRAISQRIDRSTHSPFLSDQAAEINGLLHKLAAADTLAKVVTSPTSSYNDIVTAFNEAEQKGIGISSTMSVTRWHQEPGM
jgi:hypothetical protein